MQHPFDYLELSTGTLLFTPCPGTKGVSLSDSLGQLKAAGAAAGITVMRTHVLEQNDAEHIGVIQSLIVTCSLYDINVHDYLTDVRLRIS